jgi:hypothetical protein
MTLLLCLSAGVWSALCVLAGYFVRGSEERQELRELIARQSSSCQVVVKQKCKLRRVK